jgi:hypothetical protein
MHLALKPRKSIQNTTQVEDAVPRVRRQPLNRAEREVERNPLSGRECHEALKFWS